MANLPSLKSLAELPDVPSPVLALVGAGDAAANAARELPSKIAAIDPKSLDPRGREVDFDLSKLDPRKIDLAKLDPRAIDTAALTATGLQWAAKSQETYEQLVARGESLISKAREDEWADVTDAATVAEPPAAKPAAKKTAPKAADKAGTDKTDTVKPNTTKASDPDA
jgi:hypothetical protein